MSEVTRILSAIEYGDPDAAAQLLPLVYDELRKLAAHKLAQEKPGQTLEATALVHEAYIRLVDVDRAQGWSSRGHFFAAAAEAMRRILVEQARRRHADKRGGRHGREELHGPGHVEEDGFTSVSFESDRPFALDKFQHFLDHFCPKVYRAKGILWMDGREER
jgi:RNA polymerase sigma factor (TIGR02999 family)